MWCRGVDFNFVEILVADAMILWRLWIVCRLSGVAGAAADDGHVVTQERLTHWIHESGGFIHPALRINDTQHAGATIRGVITTEDLPAGTRIIKVPNACLAKWDRPPGWEPKAATKKLREAKQNSECWTNKGLRMGLLFAVGCAMERRKGNASFYAPHYDSFTSVSDFKAILPRFADEATMKTFGEKSEMWKSNVQTAVARWCLRVWTETDNDLAVLPWEDVEDCLVNYETRNYLLSVPPYTDMANTDSNVNAAHSYKMEKSEGSKVAERFGIVHTLIPIPAGSEVTISYCSYCHNYEMVTKYGIYLEGNPNRITHYTTSWCSKLKKVALALLEDDRTSDVAVPGQTAPRCKQVHGEQAPLRCNLARLAWEHCGCKWKGRLCQHPRPRDRARPRPKAGPAPGPIPATTTTPPTTLESGQAPVCLGETDVSTGIAAS